MSEDGVDDGDWRLLKASMSCAPWAGNVVHVVAEGDKEVKEELAAAVEHLCLHGSAALEGVATADNESKVVGTQLGVAVGSVGVGVTGGEEDGVALDTGA